MTALTYETARKARLAIQSKFKDDCSDWTLADWSNAALGELGEAANIIKKIRRKDFSLSSPGIRGALAYELADTLAYIDLLAYHAGIDLSEAVEDKFNSLCDRYGVTDISLNNGKLIIPEADNDPHTTFRE